MPAASATATPAMQQYHRMKAEHPDALLFFRMGDFYEMFFEDAVTAARALDITLTSRSNDRDGAPIPMCGVPHHAAPAYVARLVKQGFRVALCEQMEDPRAAKGVVRREVVRVVTPGTQMEAQAVEAGESAFVLALAPGPTSLGAAWLEATTGEFFVAEWSGPGRWEAPARRAGRRAPARDPRRSRRRAARLDLRAAGRRRDPPQRDRREMARRALGSPAAAGPLRRGHAGGLRLREPAAGHGGRRRRPALRARDPEARPHARHGPARARSRRTAWCWTRSRGATWS